MDLKKLRPEFVVYVIGDENGSRDLFGKLLSSSGYQVETFKTPGECTSKIKLSPPHIVISAAKADYLNQVKQLSSDIEYIQVITKEKRESGVKALESGAYGYLEVPMASNSEVVLAADRAAENIYLRMENEQLHEELGQKSEVSAGFLEPLLAKISHPDDPDQVLQNLVDELSQMNGGLPVLFLKFLPAYQSLAINFAAKVPLEDLRTVGVKLDKYEAKEILRLLNDPNNFPELKELMIEVFKCPDFFATPFNSAGEAAGLIVSFGQLSEPKKKAVLEARMVSELSHNNALLNLRLKDMSLRDTLTGAYGRKFFNEKLEEEMSRSRRTHYPLSFIHLDIDNFKNYNEMNGRAMGDIILKSICQIITRTGRKTDIAVRLSDGEFGILCPHTPAVGAAVKAEKIRITVESTKFPHGDRQPLGKVTISIGVSEYPSIVHESNELVRSAADALFQVKEGGRNRVCLAEPPSGFKPDFEPLSIPGFKALPGTVFQPM